MTNEEFKIKYKRFIDLVGIEEATNLFTSMDFNSRAEANFTAYTQRYIHWANKKAQEKSNVR